MPGTALSRLERAAPWCGAVAIAAVIVAFYLLREHFANSSAEWLYLLLLACPLIHLFLRDGAGRGVDRTHDRSNHQGR